MKQHGAFAGNTRKSLRVSELLGRAPGWEHLAIRANRHGSPDGFGRAAARL